MTFSFSKQDLDCSALSLCCSCCSVSVVHFSNMVAHPGCLWMYTDLPSNNCPKPEDRKPSKQHLGKRFDQIESFCKS